jgi:hypothetical protein
VPLALPEHIGFEYKMRQQPSCKIQVDLLVCERKGPVLSATLWIRKELQ